MTTEHPITPPPELTDVWKNLPLSDEEIFVIAARWGADQELEACCEWVENECPGYGGPYEKLRDVRRPKPLSLARQAMEAQQRVWNGGPTHADWELIRAALERLQELESNG